MSVFYVRAFGVKRSLQLVLHFVTIKFAGGNRTDEKGERMTKGQFLEQLTKRLKEEYAGTGWDVESDILLKNNDIDKYAVIFCPPGGHAVTPTIYIEDYYEDYISKKQTMPEIVEQIRLLAAEVQQQLPDYKDFALDFNACKPHIFYRLVSQKRNKKLLQECPFVPFLDLAITFHVVCRHTEKGIETMNVTNRLMDYWQVGTRELMPLAEINTPRLFPVQTESLEKMLTRFLTMGEVPDDEEEPVLSPLLILTNTKGTYGASVIVYPDLMKKLAEKYNTSFYLIPSSVHEVLLMPENSEEELSDISQMVNHVNSKHVREEDILSDHAYFYDREKNRFIY